MLQLSLTCFLAFSGTGLPFRFLFVYVQIIQLQYPTRYLKTYAVIVPLFLFQEIKEQFDHYFINTYATTNYFPATICEYWIPCYSDIGFSTNLKGNLSGVIFHCHSFPTLSMVLFGDQTGCISLAMSLSISYILYATRRVRHAWTKITYQAY